ncbi:DnaJ domain-containing protein [Candidatus Dojkabacteria bacterium]|uniref:DnaJ domain-containing protein n=1 Tax=Candidatus Dojkabacteria bacterium TaxID=2099670 RepID=A0A955L5E3_9BACT|nr:DnaJ domain-containing protein [Candidatus Dojkabacteria bacterium]
MSHKTHYDRLGVDNSASQSQIKKAFRLLAKKHHPDKSKSDDSYREFTEILNAYQVLSDQAKRSTYDRFIDPQPFGSYTSKYTKSRSRKDEIYAARATKVNVNSNAHKYNLMFALSVYIILIVIAGWLG